MPESSENDACMIAMKGVMMKKKSSTPKLFRAVTLEWVARYFVLYENGKILYYRGNSPNKGAEMVMFCNNVGACDINRPEISDVSSRRNYYPNSFLVTVPKENHSTLKKSCKPILLVANGPDDFSKWMISFRKMNAKICEAILGNIMSPPAAHVEDDLIPSVIYPDKSFKVSALGMSDTKFQDSVVFPDGLHHSICVEDDFEAIGMERMVSSDEGSLEEILSYNNADVEVDGDVVIVEVMDHADRLEETSGVIVNSLNNSKENEGFLLKVPSSKESISSTGSIVSPDAFKLRHFASVGNILSPNVVESRQLTETPNVIQVEGGMPPAEGEPPSNVMVLRVPFPEASLAEEINKKELEDYTSELQPLEPVFHPVGWRGAKLFTYGNTLDELTEALSSKTFAYGIVKTSLEEIMIDEKYANITQEKNQATVKTFSIEYLENNSEQVKTKNAEQHFFELSSFCQSSSNLYDVYPIRCSDYTKVKDEISAVCSERVHAYNKYSMGNHSIPRFHNSNFSRLTAYKSATMEDQGVVPNASQVLACVKQHQGVPYNWVLFQPSKTDLEIEDAGSGGVVEMTNVLRESYNDRVLFGLARVSFTGVTFGLRPIWFGLEWTGENCTSLKMLMHLRECASSMTEMIGDRSFTIKNNFSNELSPEVVCQWVKRSCNVTDFILTVESMNTAYMDEQRAVKEYYSKMKGKRTSKTTSIGANQRERNKVDYMSIREELRDSLIILREKKRLEWSKMNAFNILKDLGENENQTGWILFEVET